jgi:hypothetical protein
MSGIAERSASEQLMYSASQVESAVSVWRVLAQTIGHLMNLMMNPVHDFEVTGS